MGKVVGGIVLIIGLLFGGWWVWQRSVPGGSPPAQAVTFLVVSDSHGPRSVYRQLLERAKERGAQFAVHLGDLTENGEAAEFTELLELEKSVGLPVHHIPGNHDLKGAVDGSIWKDSIGPLYQAITAGPARLLLLNNADRKVGFDTEQLNWLETELKDNSQSYSLVFYHRPFGLPLESIFGDDETPTSRPTTDALLTLLKAYSPAHIFTGHVHIYLPYTLEGIPATLTGGGGDEAQSLLGGANSSFFHGVLVHLEPDGPTMELLRLSES